MYRRAPEWVRRQIHKGQCSEEESSLCVQVNRSHIGRGAGKEERNLRNLLLGKGGWK